MYASGTIINVNLKIQWSSFLLYSSRIRILQLTFALVCTFSEGLLTTEKHHLEPFCLLIFCILYLSIQIKYLFFLDTQGTELKSVFHFLRLFLQIGQILSSGFLQGLTYRPVFIANLWLRGRSLVRVIRYRMLVTWRR